jgi:hypothetical protein
MLKVFQEVQVGKERFAILLDEEDRMAYECIWDNEKGDWEWDFSYGFLDVTSEEVAKQLNFYEVRERDFAFEGDLVKLYLNDENGNSPCFGVDEEMTWDKDTITDYMHYLVSHEGFKFVEDSDWLLREDDGKLYRVCWHHV